MTIGHTTSHSIWYEDLFINNDTLFILTLDKQVVLLDANSGDVLAIKDDGFVTKRFDANKQPKVKLKIYYNIKYLERYQTPDLANGQTFIKPWLMI